MTSKNVTDTGLRSFKRDLPAPKSIAIVGIVGVPANYGGFETLVENLLRYHHKNALMDAITVYCSAQEYPSRETTFLSAKLKYISLKANGFQSVFYDVFSLLSAILQRSQVILLLGVSGCIALPLVRLFSSSKIITNIDGIEWRRSKWGGIAKRFLRLSERMAVRFSHEVIADNPAIASYVKQSYGVDCHVIAYGGDHAVRALPVPVANYGLPKEFAFSVCRIEPENNIHIILHSFSQQLKLPLVIIGNWKNSDYGLQLLEKYKGFEILHLIDPIYDLGKLNILRSGAVCYVHGHSAGGTNPSLVEAMHFGKAVLAYDCDFNRATTEDKALFFKTSDELVCLLSSQQSRFHDVGLDLMRIAQRLYTWDVIAHDYFKLLQK